MDTYTKYLIIIILVVAFVIGILVFLLYPILNSLLFPENFTNASGFGFNHSLQKPNTLIPLTYVSRSTDFNLLAFLSQLRVNNILDPNAYVITKTQKGIVEKTSQYLPNVIMFSGNTDMILKQDNEKVWPQNFEELNKQQNRKFNDFINYRYKKYTAAYPNSTGHLNPINVLLKTIGYQKEDRINEITYDFRFLDEASMNNIYNQFIEFAKKHQNNNSSNHSNKNNIIIAYDFGAVIANICIQKLINDSSNKYLLNTISKLLLICPTIGGVPMTIRDYFSGNGVIDPKYIYKWNSVLMSMPHKDFYDNPVMIYNSVGYKAHNLKTLIENNWFYNNNTKFEGEPDHKDFIKNLDEISKFQDMSIKNPLVNTIIITNNDNNTPICYNFENSLRNPPARYLGLNNNQHSNSDIHQNNSFEGLPVAGDKVLPFETVNKLYNKWNTNKNVTMEVIKNCNHFTILQKKELALIIAANLK